MLEVVRLILCKEPLERRLLTRVPLRPLQSNQNEKSGCHLGRRSDSVVRASKPARCSPGCSNDLVISGPNLSWRRSLDLARGSVHIVRPRAEVGTNNKGGKGEKGRGTQFSRITEV